MGTNDIIVYTCLALTIISTLGVIVNRLKLKRGFGIRSIQISIVTVVFPLSVILVIQGMLPVSSVAIIIGVIVGYAFSKNDKTD